MDSQKRVKIIVDAMGGDNAPQSMVEGAVLGAAEYGTDLVLVGDRDAIQAVMDKLDKSKVESVNIEIVPAQSVVKMTDSPSAVQKEKQDSSMVIACRLLHDGKGDALISSGNTGALFTAATLYVRRHSGIRRSALGAVVNFENPFMICDSGANIDVTPEVLVQFAVMGSLYCKSLLGVENPRVALLNNGSEPCKGTPIYQEAYALLEKSGLNFVGNCEGRDLAANFCDVAVCDGFTGNIALKLIEGMGQFMLGSFKKIFGKNAKTKLSALLVSNELRSFKNSVDVHQYGGAPFLGIAKPVIKSHGAAKPKSIMSTIRQARDYVLSGLNEEIAKGIAERKQKNEEGRRAEEND